jgi:hypothetical protein
MTMRSMVFQLGVHLDDVVAGEPRYFNFYVTESADVLKSAADLARLDHPTPLTRVVMAEIFKDMIRTVCRQTLRLGTIRPPRSGIGNRSTQG